MLPHCIARAIGRHGVCCRIVLLLLSGLPILALAPVAKAQDAPIVQAAGSGRFAVYIAEASRRFRIPEHWIRAVLAAESAYDVRAVSSAGAMGLMQVMPATWAELRARHRLGDDPFDPRDNILAGTAYLREMLDRYNSIGGMLAAYNAGPTRYDEYLATGRPLPAETRAYVAALAPLLGGKLLPDGAVAAPRRTDWREAPLFVIPPAGGSPDGSRHPIGDVTAQTVQSDDAMPPASEGIFVARSEPGASQ
ncbi:lytic transglycosylase domain-containing protein [Mesorhizobium sp.]|uniref:lytic transglycosylase domain-containing protein n=1 Tax=Mesorhizobium sp. TaxID=1871066 RepID=UPI000FE74F48|nr:lytic transglycosylase domain-containing protein [Mesorhizobium sp.]RWJ31972.1 MAG: lytic transglycosylase domain-containing protein [Mesorhizobium sp.]TIQ73822.1 MAG: lytic transglycosylase domain-containing protein [Mesorhizobium sp.]